MRMVTMATAAESHMMQRSERDGEVRKSEKKNNGARGWGVPADDRGREERKEMVMR